MAVGLKRIASSLLLALIAGCAAAYADNFSFSTDSMTTVLAKGKEHTILTGNAQVTNGDTKITANRIELYGTNFRYAQCSGNVKVVDAKRGITLTSNNLFYDRTEDLSRVEGYAEMEDTKNELVVKGGFLENRGSADVTIVQIGVRILKVADNQQMACRSEFAEYDRKTDMLQLSGTPVVNWKGDTYRAARISINLKTDEIKLEGDVSGQIVSEGSSSQSSSTGQPESGGQNSAGAQPGTPPPAAGGAQ
jgi:lipopolysaccharide export system protein LptA